MATIYSLFLGILSIALCISAATGNAVLEEMYSNASVRNTNLLRQQIYEIAANEIGVREIGGDNKGPEISKYLAYVGLGDGYEWCAAFASWCYGQAGLQYRAVHGVLRSFRKHVVVHKAKSIRDMSSRLIYLLSIAAN
ncbi:C40 family peptidase [Sphingobacterium multivorum]|uniref:Uncharacterized protein n=1 Tax=Sphingobacterium multivorum TaxID=28454 RepID=A0A2X2LGT6_SPHMU|nr:hypothetical protein [Sphingobacterium multivorum]QRQ61236.1 hypothetical protein I6J33_24570 [Sphingobacterium multivorum]SPZ88530.1 Uncharacterised protein [Sphingobacterium multivorum]